MTLVLLEFMVHQKLLLRQVRSSALYCWAHPLTGGKQVVCESWRNLVSVGAEPIAITNCLNFGNPENGKIWVSLLNAFEITETSKC